MQDYSTQNHSAQDEYTRQNHTVQAMETSAADGWWRARWQSLTTALDVPTRTRQGRTSVRGCRVEQLDVQLGAVHAAVEDREQGRCEVELTTVPLTDEQWEHALDALGSKTLFVAQLLAGELPIEVESIFAAVGAPLVPTGLFEMSHRICYGQADVKSGGGFTPVPPIGNRPIAAVYVELGELIEVDPWLLFRLRGRTRQQILQALRTRRTQESRVHRHQGTEQQVASQQESVWASLGGEQPDDASATNGAAHGPLLTEQIERYWGSSREIESLQYPVTPPTIELALLRRLGPPPFRRGAAAIYEELSDVYRQVTARALSLAYSPDDLGTGDKSEAVSEGGGGARSVR